MILQKKKKNNISTRKYLFVFLITKVLEKNIRLKLN